MLTVELLNARDEGDSVVRTWQMDLVEKDGAIRARTLRSYRRRFVDGKRAVLFFEDPETVKGTALLTFDYDDATRPDDQWFYLPALRKSRRVAQADRLRLLEILRTVGHHPDVGVSALDQGDHVFAVVGVARVARTAYPDPTATEGDWSAVDLEPVKPLRTPVTLAQLKSDPITRDLLLIRNSRLSVTPVPEPAYRHILKLGGEG